MKLTDLHPNWMGAGGDGVSQPGLEPCASCAGAGCEVCHSTGKKYIPAPERHGVGVILDCPCGCESPLYVPFSNPLDGGAQLQPGSGWNRTGETFETLTLTPSILRSRNRGGCGWHGFITGGVVTGRVE